MKGTATLRRNFPTLSWLITAPFHWFGKSRRRIWGGVAVLLGMIAGPPLWWAIQLVGLPDIGEPFDVQEFRSLTIPDDRNAFVLYHQAAARFKPLEQSDQSQDRRVNVRAGWSKAAPEVRRWVEENREALALFRQAAERPDALEPPSASLSDSYFVRTAAPAPGQHLNMRVSLALFQEMALLEASRREEHGDMAGAWEWYRAVLRALHHLRRHATVARRMAAQRWHTELRGQMIPWIEDARTSPALLHRALEDVLACEALAPSDSYTLKAEYLNAEGFLAGRNGRHLIPPAWLRSLGSRRMVRSLGIILAPEQIRPIAAAWSTWRREPERSRRVIRLVTANWLAFYDLPPNQRPSPDIDAAPWELYAFGPSAPAKARALSPEALGRWLDTADYAQEILRLFMWRRLRIQEHVGHRELVIRLASELYRRDHGAEPPEPEALVGPYLKRLPPEIPEGE